MSRQRFIYPDLFDSEKFSMLSLGARVLWIGMFTTADDYGKGRSSIKALKHSVFPYDDFTLDQVAGWLSEIASMPSENGDAPWIELYECSNSRYYRCMGWSKRQNPRYKAASRIPDPQVQPAQPLPRSAGGPPDIQTQDPRRSTGDPRDVVGVVDVVGVGVVEGRGRGRGSGSGRRGESKLTPEMGEEFTRRLKSVAAKASDPDQEHQP
jgi:hypothetical protein